MTLVLAFRHAQVENPEAVIYARLPGFPLSATGRQNAEGLGRLLASAPVAAVYSSPLDRSYQTAQALAAPHGLDVMTDDRLLEWAFWVRWQGRPWQGLPDREPEVRAYAQDPSHAFPEDPLEDVGKRVLQWAEEAAALQESGVVFGVSHEAPIAAAYIVGRGADFAGFRGINVPHLGAVRLLPGPPELVDPVEAVHRC
jgi:broad specificity phosphatase PhoE